MPRRLQAGNRAAGQNLTGGGRQQMQMVVHGLGQQAAAERRADLAVGAAAATVADHRHGAARAHPPVHGVLVALAV